MSLKFVGLSAALLVLGCGKKTATQVIVELHAEPGVLEDARALRVVVENEEGKVVLNREKAVDRAVAKLARIPLVPKGHDSTRRFRVVATLLNSSGEDLSRIEARAGYIEDELTELELWFRDACTGKLDCGEGRTCHQGQCVGSCFTPGTGGPATPECKECQVCGDACVDKSGMSCGCDGETCNDNGSCDPLVRVSQVGAGSVHTCAALESSPYKTYCWGSTTLDSGEKGRLGTGAGGVDSLLPVEVPGLVAREGITAGIDHTCTVSFGRRMCFGSNDHGALGGNIGVVVPNPHEFVEPYSFKPIASGFFHTCAVDKTKDIYCWGDNSNGSLGLGATSGHVRIPTAVVAPTVLGGFRSVAAGGYHTCGLAQTGGLYCWGLNASSELGVTLPIPPGEKQPLSATPLHAGCEPQNTGEACFDDFTKVAAGAFHTCAIRESGELWCFGGNENGQLGVGHNGTNEGEPIRVMGNLTWSEIGAGYNYTCGLTLDTKQELYCWGDNTNGQLGIADVGKVNVPTRVAVDAPAGWRSLAMGFYHACAIRGDRTLWCWGRNTTGQLGIGRKSASAPPTRVCFPRD